MEPRILVFFTTAVLVILSGRSAHSQVESIVDDPQHSTEGVKLFWKWLSVYFRSAASDEGGPCSATVDQTYAYVLLQDLIWKFKPNGTIDYLLRRKPFYTEQFDGILVDALNDNVTHCAFFESTEIVCDPSNNTCVKCDRLPAEIDPKLREACGINGTGGENAEQVELIPGELPEADRLSRPPLGEDEGACGIGWLTAKDAKKWQKEIKETKGVGFANCSMNVEAVVAVALLKGLMRKGGTALETEIAEYGYWWEERLWVFRGGKHLNLVFCSSGVCGKDGFCVSCSDITESPATELTAACPTKGGVWRPADVKTRGEICADSKPTTVSHGRRSTVTKEYTADGTTESRGVGMWSSPLAIAVAVFFQRLLI